MLFRSLADPDKLTALATAAPHLLLPALASTITPQQALALDNLGESDPLQIVFTSGTTAEPKGIVHTHKNVLASLAPIEREMHKYLKYERIFHPLRFLHTLPLSHVFGQFMGLWIPPLLGAEVHYESRLIAADVIARIHAKRISVLACVPRLLNLLETYLVARTPDLASRIAAAQGAKIAARWYEFRDIHRLFGFKFWAFVCGGASLPSASEQFWNALGFAVVQGYGMTETTAVITLNHPFRPARGAVGQVLPGREVRLGPDGEVLVRGETISNATWQHGALQPQASGWLSTGDLAEFDERGNLRFRGRKKDVIVTAAGLNIYPEDLEAALIAQPGVRAASVIETSNSAGPQPLAALVLEPGADPDTAIAAANGALADFQQIRDWLVWPDPDLPRTSTGKVLRREVARRIASGEIAAPAAAANRELSLDSLGRVQLQAQLERQYGVTLNDAAVQQAHNEAEIRQLVTQAAASPAPPRAKTRQHIYPRWPWAPIMRAVRIAFLELIAMPLVRLLAKPRVSRPTAHWPDSPVLIVANHVTTYDASLVLYALPPRIRHRVAFAMSGEMLLDMRAMRKQGNWFLDLLAPIGYLLITALFNVFPLPQLTGFRRSFRHAGEAADRGYSVCIFPEGRRADDENAQPFRLGAGLLWNELGTPALPIRLHGLGELKRTGARWFRSGRIAISVGELLPLDPAATPEQLTERLRAGVFDQRTGSR